MSQEAFKRRRSRLEEAHETLEGSRKKLNTTIALLNQTVETMAKREEKRQQFIDRTILFVVGGIISAFIAWVVRGGLGQ
jgi:ABC-type transporter Mla subunit MlaD